MGRIDQSATILQNLYILNTIVVYDRIRELLIVNEMLSDTGCYKVDYWIKKKDATKIKIVQFMMEYEIFQMSMKSNLIMGFITKV